ncbi:MAG: hybrid sensor histidine kinase/response regulator, partial [Rhodothermia bacterium]|nr:hybrid sensor histidine kinase/response regulator [Rhodothermia bacterium]
CLQPEFRVVEAAEGAEALEVLTQILPDLILSDVMMPGMDGYELAEKLKKDPVYSHIPLVLLTAKASETSKIQGLEMGIDDYMSKPFNARELRARLRNLIRIREQEKELRELNENLERRVQDHLGRILDDRRRYEQELISARDKAEASARLKSTILDNVSHELRTPLSTILGYAQLLSKEIDDGRRDFAVYIERSGRRLLDTVSAILDLSQLESGSVVLEPEAFKVTGVVSEVLARFESEIEQKGLALEVSLPDAEIDMRLDREKLVRILSHVVGNAVKFTESGEISVAVSGESDNVIFRVRDTGPGISKSFVPDLFTAFKQESSGFDRSHEGSGLGLAICKGLVDLMYGRIDVESRIGEGSTFTVVLPKVMVVDPRTARQDRPAKSSEGGTFRMKSSTDSGVVGGTASQSSSEADQ